MKHCPELAIEGCWNNEAVPGVKGSAGSSVEMEAAVMTFFEQQ